MPSPALLERPLCSHTRGLRPGFLKTLFGRLRLYNTRPARLKALLVQRSCNARTRSRMNKSLVNTRCVCKRRKDVLSLAGAGDWNGLTIQHMNRRLFRMCSRLGAGLQSTPPVLTSTTARSPDLHILRVQMEISPPPPPPQKKERYPLFTPKIPPSFEKKTNQGFPLMIGNPPRFEHPPPSLPPSLPLPPSTHP